MYIEIIPRRGGYMCLKKRLMLSSLLTLLVMDFNLSADSYNFYREGGGAQEYYFNRDPSQNPRQDQRNYTSYSQNYPQEYQGRPGYYSQWYYYRNPYQNPYSNQPGRNYDNSPQYYRRNTPNPKYNELWYYYRNPYQNPASSVRTASFTEQNSRNLDNNVLPRNAPAAPLKSEAISSAGTSTQDQASIKNKENSSSSKEISPNTGTQTRSNLGQPQNNQSKGQEVKNPTSNSQKSEAQATGKPPIKKETRQQRIEKTASFDKKYYFYRRPSVVKAGSSKKVFNKIFPSGSSSTQGEEIEQTQKT